MILGVGAVRNKICHMNFGTHNGIFHVDEVVGIAILDLAFIDANSYVVRTRDQNELNQLDVVIDVGGGKFDHHQKGYNGCRSNGEPYASAGLVWKEYGKMAIKSVIDREGISLEYEDIQAVQEELDKEVIIPIDLEDNGIPVPTHYFSFVTKFLPSWMEEQNYDACFGTAQRYAYGILYQLIKDKAVSFVTRKELGVRLALATDGIAEIPAQTMPWVDVVIEYNQTHSRKVSFVIFHYPAGGWAAQCVPPSLDNKFAQLIPFPKEWAGETEKTLPEISGVPDATFCHNGCFFARARSKEGVLEMCRIAMK